MDPAERAIYEGEVKAIMVDQIQIRSAEERGIEIGRQEQAFHMIVRLLTPKLGEMPTSVSRRLGNLSTAELDEIIPGVYAFTSYFDVEAWLDRRRAN